MERLEVGVGASEHGRRVLTVRGELDLATADHLWAMLEPLITPGVLLVLDAAELTFLDSSGLRILLLAGTKASASGATLRLAAPQPAVRRVLELTGVGGHLETTPDVETALADRAGRPGDR